ncbi:MAG TPA: L-seryl-tRNA(Sec) selenium transferase [Acidimicrobiia bacterium]|nr:L-seryl-tRNA(Sec) selenium transferase [Acidimicrobiia bacterium]
MTLRDLPSVDRLTHELFDDRTPRPSVPRPLVVEIARSALERARDDLGNGISTSPREMATEALAKLEEARPSSVINATGVILHTNLGRALLSPEAAAAAASAHTGYGNVEFDRATGERGPRAAYTRRLAAVLTGAEDALVVNNNAGALFLVLLALAAGRAVPVSRGELIEIGGSYRLPELMTATGAELIEVGTTNRTRLADYRNALDHHPALFLKVHPSNYRIEGFTEETSIDELVALGRETEIPVAFDAGSGLLDATAPWLPGPTPPWLAGEPGISQAIGVGADLVMFSGDKLLGGPQSGIIVGRADLIRRVTRHPAARALRIDAATDAALAATLEAYASERAQNLPLWRMATIDYQELAERAQAILAATAVTGNVFADASTLGAGSVPGAVIPSPVLSLAAPQTAFFSLLGENPPILTRRQGGQLLLDLRTVPSEADAHLIDALGAACRS